jgi:hypothetical protein
MRLLICRSERRGLELGSWAEARELVLLHAVIPMQGFYFYTSGSSSQLPSDVVIGVFTQSVPLAGPAFSRGKRVKKTITIWETPCVSILVICRTTASNRKGENGQTLPAARISLQLPPWPTHLFGWISEQSSKGVDRADLASGQACLALASTPGNLEAGKGVEKVPEKSQKGTKSAEGTELERVLLSRLVVWTVSSLAHKLAWRGHMTDHNSNEP